MTAAVDSACSLKAVWQGTSVLEEKVDPTIGEGNEVASAGEDRKKLGCLGTLPVNIDGFNGVPGASEVEPFVIGVLARRVMLKTPDVLLSSCRVPGDACLP